jgi:TrmH family RNA methyltransferase
MKLLPIITSRTNARVKALRAASGGDASEPGDLLAIEGENLIAEAIRSGVRFDTVFVREGSEDVLERRALAGLEAENWAGLSKDVFASAVDTASPQGIAALVAVPELAAADLQGGGVVLVVESLQDPGNFGTLLRSAEAFGVRQIFVTPETVNRWNPKVVRASAGSVFRIPVVRASLAATKSYLDSFGVRLFAAVAGSNGAKRASEADLRGGCALMVGNEGAGLSVGALALAAERIHIPCAVESLNASVAASILMYEASRQRSGAADVLRAPID